MQVTIDLPDEVADHIRRTSGDVARRVLEAFAVDGYRSGIFREYTPEELQRDFETSRQASSEHRGSPA